VAPGFGWLGGLGKEPGPLATPNTTRRATGSINGARQAFLSAMSSLISQAVGLAAWLNAAVGLTKCDCIALSLRAR
jgi:hypothetical protein